MGTIRRIRRHQHALICAAGLLGALASVSAEAETLGFAQPSAVSGPQFVPQDSFGALPLLPETADQFDAPASSLSGDAVVIATRTDMDRLSAPHDDSAIVVPANDSGPIEMRITLLFARFDEAGGETYAAIRSPKPTDLAARRWTPVVSQSLVAWAYPAH